MPAIGFSMGVLLLMAVQQEPKLIDLDHLACKTFIELNQWQQTVIVAWLKGNNLPDHRPAVIDLEKLLSDTAKLLEHCNTEPQSDVMTAAEALLEN